MKFLTSCLPLTLALLVSPMLAQAHSAHAVFDKTGDRPGFTALARATCFNDGSGEPAWLEARIRDNSAPVQGLYLSLQMLKGDQAISTTDTVSGDAAYSDRIAVYGGAGVYTLLLTHTRAGARDFEIEYHCMAANGNHAGTEMVVVQYQ